MNETQTIVKNLLIHLVKEAGGKIEVPQEAAMISHDTLHVEKRTESGTLLLHIVNDGIVKREIEKRLKEESKDFDPPDRTIWKSAR